MADATGVLVFGDAPAGQLGSTAQELLAAGRSLADSLGQELTIALLGADVARAPQQAISQGADRVLAVTSPALGDYHPDLYLSAMQSVVTETNPGIILISRNNEGRELAPRLAFRLGVGLAQDCLEVGVNADTGRLLANRPVYGGSAVAVVSCNQTPQIAAVRPKTYEPLDADSARSGDVIAYPVDIDASEAKSRVVDVVQEEAAGIKLEDARIVVSGGRGLGGPEPFAQLEELAAQLEELAALLGGAVLGGAPGRLSTRVGFQQISRSGSPARPSPQTCTSRSPSLGPASTWPAAAAPKPSSPSTRTATLIYSKKPATESSATGKR